MSLRMRKFLCNQKAQKGNRKYVCGSRNWQEEASEAAGSICDRI